MYMALLYGIATVVTNVTVQMLVVATILHYLWWKLPRRGGKWLLLKDSMLLSTIVFFALAGHLVQIGIWAVLFQLLREFDTFPIAFYHSMVNFSTLGYGDLVMSDRWRLLGAVEALTGVLMMGVSTASLFAVISRLVNQRQR